MCLTHQRLMQKHPMIFQHDVFNSCYAFIGLSLEVPSFAPTNDYEVSFRWCKHLDFGQVLEMHVERSDLRCASRFLFSLLNSIAAAPL